MICTFFFFKQKTAYEMRISDWSSDVCSSDLRPARRAGPARRTTGRVGRSGIEPRRRLRGVGPPNQGTGAAAPARTRRSRSRRDAQQGRTGRGIPPDHRRSDRRVRSEESREGKEVSVRVDTGGRRILKNKHTKNTSTDTRKEKYK